MSDTDTAALAEQVIEELDPGTVIEDKVILSKRQLIAIAGSGLGAGALAAIGADEATAQSAAGQVGTSSEPVDVEAHRIGFPNLSNDYEIQKDGTDGSNIINFKTS
jgi:hypothetical protein